MDLAHDTPPPPYSETDIYSQPGNIHTPATSTRAADDAFSSSTGDVQFTPPQTPTTARSVPAEPRPAVAAYFDSRPAPSEIPSERLEHTITVDADTRPEDLALQPGFATRDVTEQDWRTFANFLLPDHAARSNEEVVDRKLRASSDEGSARGDAEAQLGSIRSDDEAQSHSASRREDVERTVEEWNVFFFGPRGISIRLNSEPARQIPGAWDQSFDNKSADADNGATSASAARGPANQRSWGLGGIRVTEDGISIGSMIEAHRRGIRFGQLTADESGISYAGRPIAPAQGHHMAGRGYGGYYGAGCPAQAGTSQERGGQTGAVGADRSCSSGSSSDSDSESDDGDEIEDLLDYDELLDGEDGPNASQYHVCTEAMKRWLNAPEQQIAEADLRTLRQQMRSLHPQGGVPLSRAEKKERKKELKALIKAVKSLARRQKQVRREVRRQERQQRRAGRRERRQQQREVRRARREQRRDGRRGRGCGVSAPSQPAAPPAPHGVSVPSQPAAPPAPPGVPGVPYPAPPGVPGAWPAPPGRGFRRPPPMPHGPPTPGHPFAGRARSFGPYHGRESFFAHHVAPYGWPHAGPSGRGVHRGHHEGLSRAAEQLEARVVERTEALSRLEGEMAGNTSARGWSARRMEGRKHALEKEIEALQLSLEGLRVQADGEYAKVVAEEVGAVGATKA